MLVDDIHWSMQLVPCVVLTIFSGLLQLVPCVVLTIFTGFLVSALYQVKYVFLYSFETLCVLKRIYFYFKSPLETKVYLLGTMHTYTVY